MVTYYPDLVYKLTITRGREYLLAEFDCMSCRSSVSDMEFTPFFANMPCDILQALTSTNECTS